MLQFACEARVRVSGSVNHFPNFVIGAVRGPLKILKKRCGFVFAIQTTLPSQNFDKMFCFKNLIVFFLRFCIFCVFVSI